MNELQSVFEVAILVRKDCYKLCVENAHLRDIIDNSAILINIDDGLYEFSRFIKWFENDCKIIFLETNIQKTIYK